MRAIFLYFIIKKICVDFSIIRFSVFRHFVLHTALLSKSFLMLPTFFQVSLYFRNNFSSLIKKDIHSFTFLKIFSICTHFQKEYAERSNFVAFLWLIKYLKSLLPIETLLDTTILIISILFIQTELLYWWNFYFSISVSPNLFTIFVIYNFPLFFIEVSFLKFIIF